MLRNFHTRLLLIAFTGSILFVLIFTVVVYRNFTNINQLNATEQRIDGVLQNTEAIFEHISDFEKSYLNYLVTGNKVFLEPYYHALDRMKVHFAELNSVAVNNAGERERVQLLQNLVEEETAFGKKTVAAYNAGARHLLPDSSATGRSDAIMDSIEYVNRLIKQDGGKRMAILHTAKMESTRNTFVLIFLYSVLVSLVFIGFSIALKRNLNIRANAEKKLTELNAHLEDKIKQRTGELEDSAALVLNTLEHLKKSEEKWRALTEKSPDQILQTDLDGKILFINYTQPGLTKEQVIGKFAIDFVPENKRKDAQKCIEDVIKSGQRDIFYSEYAGIDGGVIYFESVVNPVSNVGGVLGLIISSRDITERKNLEMSLRHYEHIVSCSEEMLALLDKNYKYLTVNDNYSNAFGLKKEDIIGHTAAEIFGNDFFEKVIKPKGDKCMNGENVLYETYIDFPLAGKKCMEVIYSAYKDKAGHLLGMVVNARDITERRKAEKTLQESENNLRHAELVFPIGYWKLTLDDKMISGSEGACKIYGTDKTVHTIREMQIIPLPQYRKQLDKALIELIKENKPYSEQFKIKRQNDGAIRVIHSTAEYDVQSRTVFGVLQDITEQKKAEETLAESEKNLTRAELVSKFGYWRLTLDDMMTYASAGAQKIYGIDKVVLTRDEVISFRLPEYVDVMDKGMQALVEENKPFDFEYKIKRWGDGAVRDIHTTAEYNAETRTVFGIVQDITESKKAEVVVLHKTEELRNLYRHLQHVREEERKDLARNLHDELGQQLTGIKMDMVWMRKRIAASDEGMKQKMADALNLVDESVKTVRRINAELRPAIIDDLGLFAALEWKAEEFTKRTNIKCLVNFNCNEPVLDKNINLNIFRIFQEALNNIAKHSRATEAQTEIHMENAMLHVSIRDNGIGFERQNSKQKKSFGLSGMEERAAMMEGQLKIYTTEGKGTTINLTIPVSS